MNRARNWTDFGGIKPSGVMPNSAELSPKEGIIFHQYSPARDLPFESTRNNRYDTRQGATTQLRLGNGLKRNNYHKNKNNKRKKAFPARNNDKNNNETKKRSPTPETHGNILEKYVDEFNPRALSEVIRLMNRQSIEYNSIGEDVELLTILFFNGMHFHCSACKAVYVHASTMQENHLKSAMHSKNVSSLQEIPPYERILKNAFTPIFFDSSSVKKAFNDLFDIKLSAEDITSQFEFGSKCTQRIHKNKSSKSLVLESTANSVIVCKNKFFDGFFGEEFIKPLSGFHCTLCKVIITQGSTDSIGRHISTLVHQNNLKNHLIKNQDYQPGFMAQDIVKKALVSKDDISIIMSENNYISNLPFSISDETSLRLSPTELVTKQVDIDQQNIKCDKNGLPQTSQNHVSVSLDCGSPIGGVNNEVCNQEELKSVEKQYSKTVDNFSEDANQLELLFD